MSRGEEKAACRPDVLRRVLTPLVEEQCAERNMPVPQPGTTAWLELAAGFAGVSRSTLSKMLAGQELTAAKLSKAAAAMSLKLKDLLDLPRGYELPDSPKEYSDFSFGYYVNEDRHSVGKPTLKWFCNHITFEPNDVFPSRGRIENDQGVTWELQANRLGARMLVLTANNLKSALARGKELAEPAKAVMWDYFTVLLTACYPLAELDLSHFESTDRVLAGYWCGFTSFGSPAVRRMFCCTRPLAVKQLAAICKSVKLFLDDSAAESSPNWSAFHEAQSKRKAPPEATRPRGKR